MENGSNETYGDYPETIQDYTTLQDLVYGSLGARGWGGGLNQTGVHTMMLECAAMPVRYLDGVGIPMRYKLRRVEGEPVPLNVLAEMERHRSDPWRVRDRLLREMGWCSKRISWQPGRIASAVTI